MTTFTKEQSLELRRLLFVAIRDEADRMNTPGVTNALMFIHQIERDNAKVVENPVEINLEGAEKPQA